MKSNTLSRDDIFAFARREYKTIPEYLWARTPNFAVLRRNDNKKWYAIIMDLPRHTMKLSGNGTVDVINVKCDSILIGMLMGGPYRPAWHMNKSTWISIILDDTAPRDEVLALIRQSYHLAGEKNKCGQK